ncbi:MAG: Hydrogenase 2 maturation protease [Syntrophaceae bacterium PtaU1.Bin231]|nr:MAG: Hydrogenase 2 maturation protease [Syntrophaceae bacterium PtaU1.Bin231]
MVDEKLITVLGIGNILLRDEGFGVHFVRWFSERYRCPDRVRIVDGGTLGYGLLDIICSSSHLFVIDVIKLDDQPGSVYRFTKREMETRMPPPTSAHEVSFPDVLFKAELLDESPETVFLCVVPRDFAEMGMEMTPEMKERFPVVESMLLREFEALGVRLERNPESMIDA